jgi:hypothetical protein
MNTTQDFVLTHLKILYILYTIFHLMYNLKNMYILCMLFQNTSQECVYSVHVFPKTHLKILNILCTNFCEMQKQSQKHIYYVDVFPNTSQECVYSVHIFSPTCRRYAGHVSSADQARPAIQLRLVKLCE